MTQQTLSDAWCTALPLTGSHVRLEPLSREHAEGLRRALSGDELSRLWYTNVPAVAGVDKFIDGALGLQDAGKALPFVVREVDGPIVGSTRLYDLDRDVPRLNIGYTWYAPRVQRTAVNSETKLLLLRHAFESMGCICVGFETSSLNIASRKAIARLGARQDGVLRNHKRHADGSPRDTVAFSIIDSEWPEVKRSLVSRLERDRHSKGGIDGP